MSHNPPFFNDEKNDFTERFHNAINYYNEIKSEMPQTIQEVLSKIELHYADSIKDESYENEDIEKCVEFQEKHDMAGWDIFFCPETDNYKFVIDNIRPEDVVFDVGAGDLRLDLILSQRCKKVYAVEINPRIIGPAIDLIGFDMPINLIPICGDAVKFPLPNDVTTIVILVRHLVKLFPEEWYEKRVISNAAYEELRVIK